MLSTPKLHVPQDIFLLDGTIAENIAFGLSNDEIDVGKIEQAAKSAQIHEFVSELPEGYNTYVGDRGVRLSGGRRQHRDRQGFAEKRILILMRQPALLTSDKRSYGCYPYSISRHYDRDLLTD